MKRFIAWFNAQERNERVYWLAQLFLFIGLTGSASIFTALTVVGAVMVVESVITSYIAALVNARIS